MKKASKIIIDSGQNWVAKTGFDRRTVDRIFRRLRTAYMILGGLRHPNKKDVLRCRRAIIEVFSQVSQRKHRSFCGVLVDLVNLILLENPISLTPRENILLAVRILVFGIITWEVEKRRRGPDYLDVRAALKAQCSKGMRQEIYIVFHISKSFSSLNSGVIDAGEFGVKDLIYIFNVVSHGIPEIVDDALRAYRFGNLPPSP